MNSIAIEDLATLFATEFVKNSKEYLMPSQSIDWIKARNIPFLKMNYSKRRKIVENILEKIEKDLKKNHCN
jgi:hypothetical protein